MTPSVPAMPDHSMGPRMQQGNMQTSGASRLDEGEEFYVLKLAIKNRVSYDLAVPARLST